MKTAVLNRIINEKGETLFLLRKGKPFGWGLPGGKVDGEETPEQACVREVQEETGINLTETELVKIGPAVSSTGIPLTVFETILDHTPNVKINSGEHLSARWIKTHTNEFQRNYTDEVKKLVFAGTTLSIIDLGKKIFIPEYLSRT